MPAGALRDVTALLGRVLAAPVRRGEPITDVRLVGPSLLGATTAGLVAVPVRIADAGRVRQIGRQRPDARERRDELRVPVADGELDGL